MLFDRLRIGQQQALVTGKLFFFMHFLADPIFDQRVAAVRDIN